MKILKSYRLEKETIKKLDELATIYQQRLNNAGITAKFTMTDVIETLVNREYAQIKEDQDERQSKTTH